MTAIDRTTTEAFEELTAKIRVAANEELVGLYAYGSYVAGGFEPGASDLDLVAVLSAAVGREHVARFERVHDDFVRLHPEWTNRLDIVYVGRTTLASFRDGHGSFAVISPGEPFHLRTDVADWLQSWYLLRETSRPVVGVDAAEVVPPIAREEFLAALAEHADLIRTWSRDERSPGALAYEVLTACRILQTVRANRDPSKAEAAAWARERWPASARVIDIALECRRSGGRVGFDDEPSREKARRFIEVLADEVAATRRATPG